MSSTARSLCALAAALWLVGTGFRVAVWAHHGWSPSHGLAAVLVGGALTAVFAVPAVTGQRPGRR